MSGFYLSYALRSIRRGGQRSLLAIACVAFGVLALVSMQLLASMLLEAMIVSPRYVASGDLRLTRPDGPILAGHLQQLDSLKQKGVFQWYTPKINDRGILLKKPGSGQVQFANQALGVDPYTYPLLGTFSMARPEGQSFARLIERPGTAVITGDLARSMNVDIDSVITLSGEPGTVPMKLTVTGIIERSPDRRGRSVFYNIASASQVTGSRIAYSEVMVTTPDTVKTRPALESAGWKVTVVSDKVQSEELELFAFMLPGAGLLGLLVGGIGVANTMQVVLARRKGEVATLKALGYRRHHLLALFGTETGLIGLTGGILGVIIGTALSGQFLYLLRTNIPFQLIYRIDPWICAGGLLVGVLTAMIFGLAAIVRTSGVRPAVLMRDLPLQISWRTRMAAFGLYGLLLVLFGLLSSVVLRSFLKGFGVVTIGLVGLLLLGVLLGGLMLLLVRMPAPGASSFQLALRNLRHRPVRAAYALVALFVGIFSIGFAAASMLNAGNELAARTPPSGAYNLVVYPAHQDLASVRHMVSRSEVLNARFGLFADGSMRYADGEPARGSGTLEGRTDQDMLWDVTVREGTWTGKPTDALAPVPSTRTGRTVKVGDTLEVTTATATMMLRVSGLYGRRDGVERPGMRTRGLLVGWDVALRAGGDPAAARVDLAIEPRKLHAVRDQVARAYPDGIVVDREAILGFQLKLIRALFFFVIAVAGLSLVAGAVLIANAVGLSMLERRRELGVLKAVGYTSERVLRTVLYENVLLGMLAGLAGLAGVHVAMAYVNAHLEGASLSLGWLESVLLVLVSVLFASLAAAAVAWYPTHIRPLAVLRAE